MAANTQPIYSKAANVSQDGANVMNSAVTAAANDYTGAGANNSVFFTAGANGSFVSTIRFKPIGTNVASVARLFLNNGSSASIASNNQFFGEVSLPATTAIATASTIEVDYSLNKPIPAAYRLLYGLGTAVAAGWIATPWGGNY